MLCSPAHLLLHVLDKLPEVVTQRPQLLLHLHQQKTDQWDPCASFAATHRVDTEERRLRATSKEKQPVHRALTVSIRLPTSSSSALTCFDMLSSRFSVFLRFLTQGGSSQVPGTRGFARKSMCMLTCPFCSLRVSLPRWTLS